MPERLKPMRPGELDSEQAALYERIVGGPRSSGPQHFALKNDDGSLRGPFNALLLSPSLGSAVQEVGAAVRYRTELSARVREIAILTVAAHWDSAFEREAHESVGRAVGLSEEELTHLRAGTVPQLADEAESTAARLARALVDGDVDDALWADATAVLSLATVFELTTLVGYYSTLALQLRVFRVD